MAPKRRSALSTPPTCHLFSAGGSRRRTDDEQHHDACRLQRRQRDRSWRHERGLCLWSVGRLSHVRESSHAVDAWQSPRLLLFDQSLEIPSLSCFSVGSGLCTGRHSGREQQGRTGMQERVSYKNAADHAAPPVPQEGCATSHLTCTHSSAIAPSTRSAYAAA